MSTEIRRFAATDIPALLPLIEQYWIFEDIGLTAQIDEFSVRRRCTNASLQLGRGNERARTFYLAQGHGQRAVFELLDKTLGRTG